MIANYFGTNNTVGDTDSGDLATTGIILFSAVVPVTDTLVVGNVIANNTYRIWQTVQATGLKRNAFFNNGTNVFTQRVRSHDRRVTAGAPDALPPVGPLREAAGEYVVVRDVTVGDPDR